MVLTGENKLNENNSRMYEDKIKLGNKIYIQDFVRTIGFGFKMFSLCWFFTAVYYFLIQDIARRSHEENDGLSHEHGCEGDHMLEHIYGALEG